MNYGNLKTQFNNVLNRTDITSDLTTTFIDQGISRIQRSLRTPLNEKQYNYTISSLTASVTLPSDFLEIINLYYSHNAITRIPMSKFRSLNANNYSGNPINFTRQQSNILLFPQPSSGTLVLDYYGEFDAMSADSDENALAKVGSDLIIYAGLTFASDYFLDERGQLFEAKYNQFLNEIQEQANDQEMNGGTQTIQHSYTYTDYQDSYSPNQVT